MVRSHHLTQMASPKRHEDAIGLSGFLSPRDSDAILPLSALPIHVPYFTTNMPDDSKVLDSPTSQLASTSAMVPTLPNTDTTRGSTALVTKVKTQLANFFFIILPLSLFMGIITADMSNLEFLHLVELKVPTPIDESTLPADSILNDNLLHWTFLQSAYLLPIMLFSGAVLILQFVLLVGRLRLSQLADGLAFSIVLTALVVGLVSLLNAFVGTSVVGIIFTKMLAALFVSSALGLIAQAVELLPSQPSDSARSDATHRSAAVGFSTITFATIYGLGTAFASCSTFAGYQLASLLRRHNLSFQGTGEGPAQWFRNVFLLEGLFILGLCPVIGTLLLLSRRLRQSTRAYSTSDHEQTILETSSQSGEHVPKAGSRGSIHDTSNFAGEAMPDTDLGSKLDGINQQTSLVRLEDADKSMLVEEGEDKNDKTMFASLRRLSSFCTSPLANIAILNSNNNGGGASSVAANIRMLQQFHSGFGLWVSSLLRKIMIFIYGRMGVDHGIFDLISAGTSSRETFICGVLIVSNTVIVQLAVISLIAPLKAPDSQQTVGPELKVVPTLPGLPTLAGGGSGAISSIVWSMLATPRSTRQMAKASGQRWKDKPWWVPALLTTCVAITIAGLGLAVVASIMVPEGDCGIWIIYAATIVTYAGSIPQLPLALQQIYTVLDAELDRTVSEAQASPSSGETSEQDGQEAQPADLARIAARSTSGSVRAVRWERVGVMISTLTTIAGSELLTAWVFLMPDAAQKAFLFTSVALAVGGSVWLMFRHTWPLRRQKRKFSSQAQ